jgi:uncharacterized protein (DUF305 family)
MTQLTPTAPAARSVGDVHVSTGKHPMRTVHVLSTAAMLLAGGLSQALAQGSEHQAHHPPAAAEAGGPAALAPSPGAMQPPGMSGGGMMSPDMMRTMQGMMSDMCAAMMNHGDAAAMAGRHGDRTAMDGPSDPVTGAFAAINRRMHREMAVDAADGADRAFAEAMIAHHQGAIDMAKVTLAFGSDPKIRALAEQVIKAQQDEVTVLRQWLEDQPER